jgi:Tol biopolymer transport system component
MTPEQWQRIKPLLDAALEREPNKRADFLDRACGGDELLRRQVDSFLISYEQSGSFIEAPAFGLMAESLASDQARFAGGSMLGHYKVLTKLGAGGMGEVYLAEDTRLGRKIALKVLPPAFIKDDERVQRFQQEARAASALNHPNILTIYEIGQADSSHFIATELIEGETLRQHMVTAQVKISEALEVAIQVTSALCAAHEAGIVHRDIKPENIMLRRDGIVKVLDFGLAKLTEPKAVTPDSPTLFQTIQGMVMGTAYYMSPEQARGLAIDARTDIWSLAVVVYEMISGRPPFEGPTSSDVIAAILDREPTSLLVHSPETPKELEWILKKALRKDRDERYQTARELLTDLKNLKDRLSFEAELARSAASEGIKSSATTGAEARTDTEPQIARLSTLTLAQKWQRREVKILLAALVGLALAVTGYFWLRPKQNRAGSQATRNFSFTQLTYQSGTEFFPSLSPDGKTFIYASRASGNWDIYLQRVGGSNPINLTKDSAADDSQPAFSPDGERIAFRSERDGGGIFLMGATGESLTRVSDFGYSPAWSPDGAELVVGTEKIPQPSTRPTKSQLWTIDFKSNNRRLISEGDALQPTYSPHKYRIAYWGRPSKAGQREDIWTIPAGGGEAVRITDGTTIDINPVWSPDGKYLYFSSNRGGSLNVWRVAVDEESGATLAQPEAVTTIGAATSALQLSFSRDGHRLAYIAQEDIRNLRKVAFDPDTGKVAGEPVWISRGSLQLWFPELSPDGEWVTACSRGQQRHVYIMRPDGTDLRDLTDDNFRNDGWPRWSPDGKRIAFTSRRTGDYELWVINRDGSGLRQLTESKGGHYSPWSRDGRIAYSDHWPKNECVIIEPDKGWNEQKPLPLAALGNPSMSFEGWSFSPDSRKLAGINHLPNGSHSGIGIYDLASGTYEWLTDFGDWPVWLNDNRRLLFVSQGKILLYDTQSKQYRPVLTVTDQDVDIGSASLSRDNRMIYFTFVAAEADIWLMNLD